MLEVLIQSSSWKLVEVARSVAGLQKLELEMLLLLAGLEDTTTRPKLLWLQTSELGREVCFDSQEQPFEVLCQLVLTPLLGSKCKLGCPTC